MYNFMLAFVICAVAYVAGEYVSNATKAWVPSVFVTATLMLVGYWTVIPNNLVGDSNLIPFGSTLAILSNILFPMVLLTAARILQEHRHELQGTVKLAPAFRQIPGG